MPDDDQTGANSPDFPGAQAPGASEPAAPRRRAARRPAGAPSASAPAAPAPVATPPADQPAADAPVAADAPAGTAGASPEAEQAAVAPARTPRKRATRKAAAPAVSEPAGQPAAAGEPAAEDQPLPDSLLAVESRPVDMEATTAAPPAAKRASRSASKRAAKKTAAPSTPEDATATGGAASADTAPADGTSSDGTSADGTGADGTSTDEQPPARKRATRSRKKAAAAQEEPAADDAPVAFAPGEPAEPSETASAQGATGDTTTLGVPVVSFTPPVLFQPADVEAAPRRRSRTTRQAAAPVADLDPVAPSGGVPTDEVADEDDLLTPGVAAEGVAEEGDGAESLDDAADDDGTARRRRRRGGRGRRSRGRDGADDQSGDDSGTDEPGTTEAAGGAGGQPEPDGTQGPDDQGSDDEQEQGDGSARRRRRRRRRGGGGDDPGTPDDPADTVVHVREPRRRPERAARDEDTVTGVRGSTRLEAKKVRRREGREQGRRRPPVLSESEFLARRESVDRAMVVRQTGDRTQIAVLEDGVLVEHYVNRASSLSMAGNVYLGRVQNVLPSMEAAFVDIGRGRNAVLYAGEVNWDAAGLEGQPKRIELALKSGDPVLVQVTKDPLGQKGARLTSQISLPGRYLVYVPDGSMTGISRKLPDTERSRLKSVLKQVVPESAGVIVRTAAEGASEDELRRDVARLQSQWDDICAKAASVNAPALLYGEPDLTIKVVRDLFNEDFARLVVSGDTAWEVTESYVNNVAPDLSDRLSRWTDEQDVFAAHRIDEQLAKALDRKVWLPSGGSLVIDRTEAMVVVDVNTGKFTGKGGNLEETVTKNNLEAAEEIVRQLRLRDLGGIIVIDFIDMVLESNRELVLRRLLECLGRDRTKHQVAEVTSLGLVQMTRKRVGQGLLEAFSETCESCNGRGVRVQLEPVESKDDDDADHRGGRSGSAQQQGNGKAAKVARPPQRAKGLADVAAATLGRAATKPDQASDPASDQVPAQVAVAEELPTLAPVVEHDGHAAQDPVALEDPVGDHADHSDHRDHAQPTVAASVAAAAPAPDAGESYEEEPNRTPAPRRRGRRSASRPVTALGEA